MLILLSGKSFTGKDTLAKQFPDLNRCSIADTMKNEFMKLYPDIDMFDREQKEAHRLELKEFTHTKPLSHWIELTPYCEDCICTDIRTNEEIEYIKRKFPDSFVAVIRIEANDEVRKQRGWVFKAGYDDSYLETQLDTHKFDLVVRNEILADITKCRNQILNFMNFKNIGYGFRITRNLFNGIPFMNTANIFSNPKLRERHVFSLCDKLKNYEITHVLAIESGGYPLGMLLADALDISFVVARKPGKLPPPVHTVNYSMEYRPENQMEVQADSFDASSRVLVVDDIIVTGGTMWGGKLLVEACGGKVVGFVALAQMMNNLTIDTNIPIILNHMIIDGELK